MTFTSRKTYTKNRLAISAIFFSYGLTFASWAARIPSIQSKFDLSEAGLGSLLIALPVGSFISLPIAGYLVAKYGSKKITQINVLAYSLSLFLIAFIPSVYAVGAMLFLFGFTGNSINVAINTQAVDLGKLMKKPIMASFHGMWSLAGFGGAALGAVMIAYNLNLELHYGLVLAINLIVSLWAFSSLLHIKPTEEEKNAPTFVWPDKSLLLLGIIALCSMLIEGTMFDWSGVYFKKVVHAPTQWVGLGYVAFMISMAGVRFVADKVTAVYGSKRIIMLSGICSLVGLLLVILLPHFYITIIGFFIIGIGVSAVIPLVFDMAGNTQRMLPSIALASVSTMGFFGFLVGPPIIGFLAEALGLQISFSFIAFMALLVIILASRLKRP
ncbi:MFS transporter [Marivirga atlantica]|uniref:MFS transporter n=1 Tax=Marivirga atlantica TaxID=1548457 RepID=A0A937AF39_9BACT|nr:MFS transporter [Marivirga atlantica]MBL0765556.1 MFS transporter [Marivirga atlantica]